MTESLESTVAASSESLEDTIAPAGAGETGPPPRSVRRSALSLGRGDVVGRYLITAKLGAGGMGVVYAAYDPELDRKLAIKLLLGDPNGESMVSQGRARLLREAQALAKFSHPNIVAIHDVGEHEAGVWLAMEYIEGRTLGEWAKQAPRSWREILELMLGAGRGVAAAHAAGLIHRDLKPDNIMVGDDGRVRVMDFGLTRIDGAIEPRQARAEAAAPSAELPERSSQELLSSPLTQHGSLLGTPAYMAPEQFVGSEEVDAAADQFAFCVTLWELFYAERPFGGATLAEIADAVCNARVRAPPKGKRIPGWLRRACERGLATDPSTRWPSMQALLDELGRGQARARRRVLAGALAGVGVIVAAGFGWRELDDRRQRAACVEAGARVEDSWNDEARAELRAGLIASGQPEAEDTVAKVLPWLDAQTESWRAQREAICVAAELEAPDEWRVEDHERAQWCLDERLLELEALIDTLASADARAARNAVLSVARLRSVEPCGDRDALARSPAPAPEARPRVREVEAELARGSALDATGNYEAALRVSEAALTEAAELDWAPLIARARLRVADELTRVGDYERAESTAERAYFEAAQVGAWEVASEAALSLGSLVGYELQRFDEGLRWLEHAEIAGLSVPDLSGLREARRMTILANIHSSRGAFDEAKPASEAALALYEAALGPDHPQVALALNNHANFHYRTGAYDEALALHERALAIRKHTLGPRHSEVAMSLNNIAAIHFARGDNDRAKQLWAETLAIWEAALGPEHPMVAGAAGNLGAMHLIAGEFEEAKAMTERALKIYETSLGPEHPELGSSLMNLALAHTGLGEHEQAITLHERALAIAQAALGPEHGEVGMALAGLADAHAQAGGHGEAEALYRRSAAVLEAALAPDHTDLAFALLGLADVLLELGRADEALPVAARALAIRERAEVKAALLGVAQFTHARALAATGSKPEALELAQLARDNLRASEAADPANLERLEQWLAEQEETSTD